MFTGIVQQTARVLSVITLPGGGIRIRVEAPLGPSGSQLLSGQSVALDGVCLTLIESPLLAVNLSSEGSQDQSLDPDAWILTFDVSPETLNKTSWGRIPLKSGSFVHLELPLKWGDPLGGHIVSGHVEGVGRLKAFQDNAGWRSLTIEIIDANLRDALGPFIVTKGSIALDGVSLTVNEVRKSPGSNLLEFDVLLIPHTLVVTKFSKARLGDWINVETDLTLRGPANLTAEKIGPKNFPGNSHQALTPIQKIENALSVLKTGGMVILVDDEDRENEGDLVMAAQFTTPDAINFMAKEGRGLICLALDGASVDRLGLPLMTDQNQAPFGTAFTVSIEAKRGVTTGISAADRAHTIQTAISDSAKREDLVVPGHVFPLRARDGGVLVRAGQTEGSVDLARLAGLKPAAVICEILNPDGTMARLPELEVFSEKHNMPLVSIADLIEYRLAHDSTLITQTAEAHLPTRFGKNFKIKVFESQIDKRETVALVLGSETEFQLQPTLVRVHSECLTGDVFGSLRCDCGSQLDAALSAIVEAGSGVLLYLRQEGRGLGLKDKIRAYGLQDEEGLDTVEANKALGYPADLRKYGLGAQVLRSLGIRKMRLLSNNPKKIIGLQGFGLEVVERVPLEVGKNPVNASYLFTKKTKMGHLLS